MNRRVCMLLLCTAAGLAAALWAPSAPALVLDEPGPRTDYFWGELGEPTTPPEDRLVEGGGTGWADETGTQWFFYPNPDGESGPDGLFEQQEPETWFFNQWFYDHNTVLNHFKRIWGKFVYKPRMDPTGQFELPWQLIVALNWTTPAYTLDNGGDTSNLGPPMADGEQYIQRQTVAMLGGPEDRGEGVYAFELIIPDYNPEWVSIDIRGFNVVIPQMVDQSGAIIGGGVIHHECLPVPEPATWVLLGSGVACLAAWRRRGRL